MRSLPTLAVLRHVQPPISALRVASCSAVVAPPLDILGAAALVLGTALGGGFLALPHATAPAGALPSATVLLICWLFLLCESLLVADMVIDYAEASNSTVSLSTLGRDLLGPAGGRAVSTTFLILMSTTLVAQIAKGSSLLAMVRIPHVARCALIAATLAAFARASSPRLLGLANGFLTVGFAASATFLFRDSARIADWSRLSRADWSASWASAPSLLQLHVYCEVVPTICQLLKHDRHSVRLAIIAGSLALLIMQLTWSSLGIAVSAYAAGGLRVDPVDAILSRGGVLAVAATATAACAVATTILGTTRAMSTWCVDATRSDGVVIEGGDHDHRRSSESGSDALDTADDKPASTGRRRRALVVYIVCVGIPTLIAARARAAEAFFGAIDLAGAYPVALLWGVAPPLMTMRLQRRIREREEKQQQRGAVVGAAAASPGTLPRIVLACLATASVMFVGANAVSDVGTLLGLGRGAARWQ